MKKAVNQEEYNSEYYSKINEGWSEFSKGKVSKRLLKAIELSKTDFKGKKILDIGCGRGELCSHLAKLGAKCTGIDYSESAIKLAKKTFGKKSKFKQMDCTKIDFKKESFDAVFMMDIVEHLTQKQLEKTVKKVHKLLRPGGLLIVHTMPNAFLAKPFYFISKITGTKRGINEKVHINEQTSFSLKRLLKDFENRVYFAHNKNYFKYTTFYASHKGKIKPFVELFLIHDFSKIPILKIFAAAEIYVISKKKLVENKYSKKIVLKKNKFNFLIY